MIAIARAMPDYTIFYNGPRCGASAPDHMHFQAGNSDFLPLVQTGHAPYALTIKGSADEIEDKFIRLYAALPIADGDEEPMLNILCTCHYGRVTMTVVPRKKHRLLRKRDTGADAPVAGVGRHGRSLHNASRKRLRASRRPDDRKCNRRTMP